MKARDIGLVVTGIVFCLVVLVFVDLEVKVNGMIKFLNQVQFTPRSSAVSAPAAALNGKPAVEKGK